MKCGYCRFAEPFADVPAEFVVNGQGVCSEHVDTAAADFGRSLARLHLEPVPVVYCLRPVPRCAEAGQHVPVCRCSGVAGHSGPCGGSA